MTSPLRVAVIGAGWAAELHIQAYVETPATEVTAICSRTRSRAEEVAKRFDVPGVYTDFDAMLGAEELDVISIATPPDSHLQYTLAACARGIHVLCDKPLALNAAECKEMLDAAEAAGVKHATGHIWRHDPAILKLRSLVQEGAVGEVREIHNRCALGAPILPMTWMYDLAAGGGSLMQHGTHIIDRLRWVSGAEVTGLWGQVNHDLEEAEVGPTFHNVFDAFQWGARRAAMGGDPLPREKVSADTGYEFVATLDNNARAFLWEAWHYKGAVPDHMEIYGSAATLIWNAADGIALVRPGPPGPPEPVPVEGTSDSGAGDLQSAEEAGHRYWQVLTQAFADDILGQPHVRYPTLYDGWKILQVVDAVHASTETRAWQTLT